MFHAARKAATLCTEVSFSLGELGVTANDEGART